MILFSSAIRAARTRVRRSRRFSPSGFFLRANVTAVHVLQQTNIFHAGGKRENFFPPSFSSPLRIVRGRGGGGGESSNAATRFPPTRAFRRRINASETRHRETEKTRPDAFRTRAVAPITYFPWGFRRFAITFLTRSITPSPRQRPGRKTRIFPIL